MNILSTKTKILASIATLSVLGGCASIPGNQLTTSLSSKQVATIHGVKPATSYPLYAIGLSREARIVGIDGQYNQAQFSAQVLPGTHTLKIQTACRYQVHETRNEVSMNVTFRAGETYQLVLDSELSHSCSPKLARLRKS